MRSWAWAVALAGVAAVGHAAPLNRAVVDAKAHWVVHLDVERFRTTEVGATIVREVRRLFPEDIEEGRLILGVDPLREILGVTVYSIAPGSGVALVATSDPAAMLRAARRHAGETWRPIAVEGAGDREAHAWSMGGDQWFAMPVEVGGGGVLMARSEADLGRAWGVLADAVPSLEDGRPSVDAEAGPTAATPADLAGAKGPSTVRPATGSILFAAAVMPEDVQAASALGRSMRSIVLDVGESADAAGVATFRVTAAAACATPDDAEGVRALAELVLRSTVDSLARRPSGSPVAEDAADALARMQELVRRVGVRSAGSVVTLSFESPSAEISKAIESLGAGSLAAPRSRRPGAASAAPGADSGPDSGSNQAGTQGAP